MQMSALLEIGHFKMAYLWDSRLADGQSEGAHV